MDVGIQGERIAAVALPGTLEVEAARTIDATGRIVLPGGIEPHTHIGIPVPREWSGIPDAMTQPPEAASRAAAFGGVTTFIDFAGELPITPGATPSTEPIMQQLEDRKNVFTGHSYTDFAFHFIMAGNVPPNMIGEIGEAIQGRGSQLQNLHHVSRRPMPLRPSVGYLRAGSQARRYHGRPCRGRRRRNLHDGQARKGEERSGP